MIQRFIGHAAGEAAVADHRDHLPALAQLPGGCGDAGGGGDRGAAVAGAEDVVGAFLAVREWRQAAQLADGFQLRAAAGEHLVRVGLMAHVPDQAVVRGVVAVVQRQRELHGAQIGREVAADAAQGFDQVAAHFQRQRVELLGGQGAQVLGVAQPAQQGVSGYFGHGGVL